jgi:putative phosphoesterase
VRVGVISDIHSNFDALLAVLSDLGNYDALVCLGDLVGYGAQPNEVVSKVKSLRPDAIVMGNHDYAVSTGDSSGFVSHAVQAIEWTRGQISSENLEYLAGLPQKARLSVDGMNIAMFHGSPRDPLNEYIYPNISSFIFRSLIEEFEGDLLVLGHTHLPFTHSYGPKTVGNPGSIGQPRDGDARASYAVFEPSAEPQFQIRRIGYDISSMASKIVSVGLPRLLADRLFKGF